MKKAQDNPFKAYNNFEFTHSNIIKGKTRLVHSKQWDKSAFIDFLKKHIKNSSSQKIAFRTLKQ